MITTFVQHSATRITTVQTTRREDAEPYSVWSMVRVNVTLADLEGTRVFHINAKVAIVVSKDFSSSKKLPAAG